MSQHQSIVTYSSKVISQAAVAAIGAPKRQPNPTQSMMLAHSALDATARAKQSRASPHHIRRTVLWKQRHRVEVPSYCRLGIEHFGTRSTPLCKSIQSRGQWSARTLNRRQLSVVALNRDRFLAVSKDFPSTRLPGCTSRVNCKLKDLAAQLPQNAVPFLVKLRRSAFASSTRPMHPMPRRAGSTGPTGSQEIHQIGSAVRCLSRLGLLSLPLQFFVEVGVTFRDRVVRANFDRMHHAGVQDHEPFIHFFRRNFTFLAEQSLHCCKGRLQTSSFCCKRIGRFLGWLNLVIGEQFEQRLSWDTSMKNHLAVQVIRPGNHAKYVSRIIQDSQRRASVFGATHAFTITGSHRSEWVSHNIVLSMCTTSVVDSRPLHM